MINDVILSLEGEKAFTANHAKVMGTTPTGLGPCTLECSHLNAWKSGTSTQ